VADLPNSFWSGWVAIITILSLITLAWVVLTIYFPGREDSRSENPDEEPVWDENLREGTSAPPLWWFCLIFSAMIFSVIYLILYPGIGAYKGSRNWSQDSRLTSSLQSYEQEFMAERQLITNASLVELQSNNQLMDTAGRLFTRQCAACHGNNGRGQASLFPDLMDESWQWGAMPAQIEQTIRQGRNALMPPWQAALGDEGVQAVAEYVLQLETGADANHPGQQQFSQMCATCHGADGSGNPALGAPALNDSSWLYGSSLTAISASISQGRQGIMPAFATRLSDQQVKLLVAYLTR